MQAIVQVHVTFFALFLATTLTDTFSCRAAEVNPSNSPLSGSVRGIIKYNGKQLPAKPIDMASDPYCQKYYANKQKPFRQTWVWGKNNTLQNVVVYVSKGLPAGKKYDPPEEPAEMKQKGCMYVPHVLVMHVEQELRIENLDDTLHNVHPLPRENKEG